MAFQLLRRRFHDADFDICFYSRFSFSSLSLNMIAELYISPATSSIIADYFLMLS